MMTGAPSASAVINAARDDQPVADLEHLGHGQVRLGRRANASAHHARNAESAARFRVAARARILGEVCTASSA